jgi:membrane associated rhomboid family serine protease
LPNRRDRPTSSHPEETTLLSYAFLHGSWLHLAGNMLFLWVFGDNVEDAMGHVKFLIFFVLCGIAGGLAYAVMTPDPSAPLVGASGATSGVVAAYLMLHPKVKVWVLVTLLIKFPFQLPAWIVLGAYVVWNVFMVLGDRRSHRPPGGRILAAW